MNIVIVEDELIIAEMLSDYIKDIGYKVSAIARNYDEGILNILKHKPDFALIDINLGVGKNGIDLAKYINDEVNIPFVFVTSNADFSTVNKAIKSAPYGYLQKPFNKEDIYSAIEVGLINFERLNTAVSPKQKKLENNIIFIKESHLYVKLNLNDLLFIKSDGNYLELQTPTKKHLIRSTLKDFTSKLPNEKFINTSRSYAVNTTKIKSFGPSFIQIDDFEIPLSKNHKKTFFEKMTTL